ncbi:tRNA (cytosine-5-)-methyltransferase [Entomortierella beljakovae]|nr:tRNA (cytosine-5-)-methyltransferase [Entomortierella beljakovae]
MGYVFRECLLAPYNFGVPNDRLRYFIMARLRSSFEISDSKSAESTSIAAELFDPEKEIIFTEWPFPGFVESPKTPIKQYDFKLPKLINFIDNDETQTRDYLLSRQLILERPNFRFDILRPSSNRSSCFTKAYGSHHVASGGGLLQTQKMEQEEYDFSNSESIADLGLRFFTPNEVARLHVFPLNETREYHVADESHSDPDSSLLTTIRLYNPSLARAPDGPCLQFPEKLKAIQRYKLLGNSLNVWVVAELLRGILFANHPGNPQPVYHINEAAKADTKESETPLESAQSKHGIEENDSNASNNEAARDAKKLKAE